MAGAQGYGWRATQTSSRAVKADRHNRLGVYYPVTAGGKPIYVHAKILTIDDKLLRVGSSNLNNRSLSFDTSAISLLKQ